MEGEAEIDRLPTDLLAHIFVMITSFTDLAQYVLLSFFLFFFFCFFLGFFPCIFIWVFLSGENMWESLVFFFWLGDEMLMWVCINEWKMTWQSKQCLPEMEKRGEAVDGPQKDFELCWLEDGRWLHCPSCSSCL